MKINVLGAKYKISERTEMEDALLSQVSGYCDNTTREIVLRRISDDKSVRDCGDQNVVQAKTLRHELAHAFLFESGLEEYSRNETLVDWIAEMMPKMVKAMNKANCL